MDNPVKWQRLDFHNYNNNMGEKRETSVTTHKSHVLMDKTKIPPSNQRCYIKM